MTRGFDHTAQLGFSHNAAAGRLLGMTESQIANAIATAASRDASFGVIRARTAPHPSTRCRTTPGCLCTRSPGTMQREVRPARDRTHRQRPRDRDQGRRPVARPHTCRGPDGGRKPRARRLIGAPSWACGSPLRLPALARLFSEIGEIERLPCNWLNVARPVAQEAAGAVGPPGVNSRTAAAGAPAHRRLSHRRRRGSQR
jgi:hypothetical protein